MKPSVLLLLVFIATEALAQSESPKLPKQYLPFQGQWRVVIEKDDKTESEETPEILVTVKNFRPPSSFDDKPMEGEARVTLKRVKTTGK